MFRSSSIAVIKKTTKNALTGVYLLQLDVSLQSLPQTLLAAMFSQCSVIHQQEVGMVTVKAGLLAQRVPKLLVGPKYLNVSLYQPQHNSVNIAI